MTHSDPWWVIGYWSLGLKKMRSPPNQEGSYLILITYKKKSGEQKPKSHNFSQILNLSLFTNLEPLKRGKTFSRKKQVQISQTYTENLLSLYVAIYLSHWTGKRQISRPFRHCWKWTWTDRKISGPRASLLSISQNGVLCGSMKRILTQFNFMNNLLVPPNHYLAILQILSV